MKTTIKTIIRGNPGIVLLHDGIIIWKRLPSHLPDEAELNDKIENLSISRTWVYNGAKKVGHIDVGLFCTYAYSVTDGEDCSCCYR